MTGQWWVLAAFCCGLIIYGTWKAGEWASRREAAAGESWRLCLLLAGAALVRLVLAVTTKGYGPDIGTFSAWAGHAADGLFSFYSPGYFADYPPGYIYALWLVGKLRLVFGIDFDTPAFLLLLKLPAIICDVAATWLIFHIGRKHWTSAAGLAAAALYGFNPAVILNSAVWGQVDGILTLFILLGVWLLETSPAVSAVSFAIALLVKPQTLIFAPLPILWFAWRLLRREKDTFGDLLVFLGAAIATFSLAVLPFTTDKGPGWIIGKYADTLASYPYATLNAFNLFALTGGNFAPVEERFLFLPYGVWGYAFIALIVLFAAVTAFKGTAPSRFAYIPLFLCVSVFVLSAKMHERYLFPALALALLFHIMSHERRGLFLFAGFSVAQVLNTMDVLALSYGNVFIVPRLDPLLIAVSLANVLLWIFLVRVGYRSYLR